jgi:hypothetical protein
MLFMVVRQGGGRQEPKLAVGLLAADESDDVLIHDKVLKMHRLRVRDDDHTLVCAQDGRWVVRRARSCACVSGVRGSVLGLWLGLWAWGLGLWGWGSGLCEAASALKGTCGFLGFRVQG